MYQSPLHGLGRGLLAAACSLFLFTPSLPAQGLGAGSRQSLEGFLAPTSPGPIVGMIKVDIPSVAPYIIHATMPLPRKVFYGSGPIAPLTVLDQQGHPLETQIEVVSRHPAPGDGASVVELIVRLEQPLQGPSPVTLLVQRHDAPRILPPSQPTVADFLAAPTNLPAPVKSVLSAPGQVILAATDVFDNLYVLDLVHDPVFDQGSRRTQRYGKVQAEFRHHGWMRPFAPDSGPRGTLSHLFGVHAYFRISAGDPVIELDLRIHNGADGSTPENEAMGDLYFKKLTLLVPKGWYGAQRYVTPSAGLPYDLGPFVAIPLVEPTADGSMHMMPKQGQMHRRMVFAPEGELARSLAHLKNEGLGFIRPGPGPKKAPLFWSWWNPITPYYFPQGHLLPRLEQVTTAGLENSLTQEYMELKSHLSQGTGAGTYPVISDELGWAHPFGAAYGGMSGGDGIEFFYGLRALVAGSVNGYRYLEMLHRMDSDRMPNALYALDGTPSALEDWVLTGTSGDQYVPFYFYMKPTGSGDPFGFTTAPMFQIDYVHQMALEPSYEAGLLAYENIDVQHLVRYTGPAKALAWIGNDSLAKDDLELQAEMVHLGYHKYENSAYHHVQGTGMLADRQFVDANPGVGFPFGRGEGWGMDAMTAAYQLGSPGFRAKKLEWFQNITDLIVDGQAQCSGFIQATVYGKLLGGEFRVRQVIESSITQNGMLGVHNSVLFGKDPVRWMLLQDALKKSLRAMIRPESWAPGQAAPYSQLAVGPKDETLPPYCGQPPAGGQSTYTDAYQQWSSLAYGLELTGDPAFLDHAELMLGQPLPTLVLDQSLSNIGNRAALNALVEFLIASL